MPWEKELYTNTPGGILTQRKIREQLNNTCSTEEQNELKAGEMNCTSRPPESYPTLQEMQYMNNSTTHALQWSKMD